MQRTFQLRRGGHLTAIPAMRCKNNTFGEWGHISFPFCEFLPALPSLPAYLIGHNPLKTIVLPALFQASRLFNVKHTAEVHLSPNTVRLIVSMRPAAWKKWALGLLIGFLMALPFAVALFTGTDESGNRAVVPVIVVIVMLSFWPGIPLLWNVKGEEWIEVSHSALLVQQNWGFFQTAGKVHQFDDVRLIPKVIRTIEGVDYLTISFWSTDENGFDKHLYSNVIPMHAPRTQYLFVTKSGSYLNP